MARQAFFRANAAAVVTNGAGRVLVLRRRGVPEEAWQLPQGGIEAGEAPREAVVREVGEECGLKPAQLTVVDEFPEWLAYELPPEWRREKTGWGQVQRWFLLRIAPGAEPQPDGAEFDACRWEEPAWVLAHVVAFRRPLYARLFAHWAALLRPGG